MNVNWSQQHCGVCKANTSNVLKLMPDIRSLLDTSPDDAIAFTWYDKVHMLLLDQFPCIPNWHSDCMPEKVWESTLTSI